jgi:hypothetical protein
MAVLTWDGSGERFFETGIDKGVLYPIDSNGDYPLGVAWNGLISVTESPSGAEPTALYADNIKYLTLVSAEEFGCTIEAYTYPDEFAACDGSVEVHATNTPGTFLGQQPRTAFGLVYRTKVGNDVDGDLAYKLHLIYGCLASPSEKNYQTVNDSPEAITFSWEVSTTPPTVTGFQPTAQIIIDSRTADPTALAAFELVLFGDVATDPNLPLPDAVITAMTP